jgi:glutamyl-tRNA synthetase
VTSTLVRFAPSPTGLLHAGNARTAVLNFLFAKKEGGRLLLRIDDTDTERSKQEFEDAILLDLAWLGIVHDSLSRQSARTSAYRDATEKLKTAGFLYPCYETPEELDRKRKRAQSRGEPPVYDRAALKLTDAERSAFEAQGRAPHWRFKLSHREVGWRDLIRHDVFIETSNLSDPVLVRADGRFLYTLPSVVDDIDLGVSHVIRGEDHVTNTAAQIEIFLALGATPPQFAHHPLLIGSEGEALSKRLGSLSLRHLRADDFEPLAVASYLAKIGTSDPVEPRVSMDALAAEFSFDKIGRAPAHFSVQELGALNGRLLHLFTHEAVRERLVELGCDLGPVFWDVVKSNLVRMHDVKDLATLIRGPVVPVIEEPELLAKAAEFLPGEPYTPESWSTWTSTLTIATGKKGRALYHPLRLALTGREHGPELARLLPLIGRERALARLRGETA